MYTYALYSKEIYTEILGGRQRYVACRCPEKISTVPKGDTPLPSEGGRQSRVRRQKVRQRHALVPRHGRVG